LKWRWMSKPEVFIANRGQPVLSISNRVKNGR
jgi:hypothetical protein